MEKDEKLNIYDTKQLVCLKCEKFIGEIDYDAKISHSYCGKCANDINKKEILPRKYITITT